MSTEVQTDERVSMMLAGAAAMTEEIRALQEKIKERGVERRQIIIDLREKNVTYRKIADSMGVSEQNVYKILNRPDF